eukprot:s73_g34.t1
MAGLVCGASSSASLTSPIVFIRTVWAITVPVIEAENTDRAIGAWAGEENIEAILVPVAAYLWTHAGVTVPLLLVGTGSRAVAHVVVHQIERYNLKRAERIIKHI